MERKPASRSSRAKNRLQITVSHPDKLFWPDEGYTKLNLIEYYRDIFPRLGPYLKDRLLSLERCPDGMRGDCFFQKEAPKGLPAGVPTKRIAHVNKSGKSTNYVVGGALRTQLSLANLGTIAIHIMASRAAAPRQPDWACFDLDPESGQFADAARAALYVREILESLKLVSFAKTTGGRGLHILVPIRVGLDADEVLEFAQNLAALVAREHPNELTVEHSIAARRGRVYVDPFRNGFAQTIAAPYSVRRLPKAPISTPLPWSKVKPDLVPSDFNLGNFATIFKGANPWKEFFSSRQDLKSAIRSLPKR